MQIAKLISLNVAGYELRVTGCEKMDLDNQQLFLFFVFLRELVPARLGADLRITLQHCLQTKTRQIAYYNVNGLGQGLRS